MPITPYKKPLNQRTVIGALIAVVPLLLFVFFVYKFLATPVRLAPDAVGCATAEADFVDDRGDPIQPENVIILIDATDPIPPRVGNLAIEALDQALNRSPPYSRVRVYALAATVPAQLNPVAEACNPPPKRPEDEINAADPDPYSEYRDNSGVTDKVRNIMRSARIEPQSPILEMLNALSKQAVTDNRRRTRIVIVSDLLQKSSPLLDAYSRDLRLEDVVAGNRWDRMPNLGGVKVEVIQIINRAEDLDGRRAQAAANFWRRIFAEADADVIQVTPVGLVGDAPVR